MGVKEVFASNKNKSYRSIILLLMEVTKNYNKEDGIIILKQLNNRQQRDKKQVRVMSSLML